ncbi:putative mitochondrial chaperone bcs1 [Fulvia fulva]|uniref:Mitochondrial chaperone bcs1 n=1 Tax=Passalora fulva TaxID=5499 RepID=A0A9Q8LD34_PASFU|nr:putative mitochondrial chaperone bcs1 [Fulvia fulva]KAK4629145.1 putative mitochondrial chaperone bcs1 [Fulvia fulva]KAK4630640.1 putative mitochondrial chaperone bcs1 [Fulvia fulva]UJO15198.1 putative mitochondrial chaperone bcs1 [Fulvia fulva]WPV12243.1 putative mitochondrial chaperone bcs1 [Fulvia fulva]WPV26980.1 putative mitochondrial chaperone bcs1 [Fulvia fulva]
MPGNSRLSATRLQTLLRTLTSIATEMRGGSNRPTEFLALPASTVLDNTKELIYQSSPRLVKVLGVVIPFVYLAYALHDIDWHLLKVVVLVQRMKAYFERSISISSSEPMHHMVNSWLAEHTKTDTRSMSLQTGGPSYGSSADASLKFVPNAESTSFRFNGRTFHVSNGAQTINRSYNQSVDRSDYQGIIGWRNEPKTDHGVTQSASMKISYVSFGSKGIAPIKEFLDHVRAKAAKSIGDSQTMFYRMETSGARWAQATAKPSRSMDSVAMPRDKKELLIKDIAAYVAEGSKKWYASMGIPHRRGYLFYGPPGCGKTSAINAIAGDFNLDVFSITLSNPALTDDLLEELFRTLPERALVLLEDVDVSGIESRGSNNGHSKRPSKNKKKTGVTLSGLLNCIDGACSAEHRVLIMTANTPDSLDPALIRPGRIDGKHLFANATRDVMQQQFAHIFSDIPGVTEFSSEYNIPEDRITPAEIQAFLLCHRSCPANAVKNAKAWADVIVEEKATGRNVSSFTGRIGEVSQIETGMDPGATSPSVFTQSPSDHQQLVEFDNEMTDPSSDNRFAAVNTTDTMSENAAPAGHVIEQEEDGFDQYDEYAASEYADAMETQEEGDDGADEYASSEDAEASEKKEKRDDGIDDYAASEDADDHLASEHVKATEPKEEGDKGRPKSAAPGNANVIEQRQEGDDKIDDDTDDTEPSDADVEEDHEDKWLEELAIILWSGWYSF